MQANALRTLGGALIVTGTSIGAGMLALPVVTGPAGFFPSIIVLLACWAFMTTTGLLMAELALWLKGDANILSMAKKTLGKPGLIAAWVLYLFLFYSLSVAYMVGGGNLLTELFGYDSSDSFRIITFALVAVGVISFGKKIVDPINRLFMIGLFVAYGAFVIIGFPTVDVARLFESNWPLTFLALPVTFASFGFQGTVPLLASWMHYDRRRIRRAIVIGTSITLFIYLVWQWLFLGIVPKEGPNGLLETLREGRDAVYPLQYFTSSAAIWTLGRAFAFFALVTSFLGVGVGLVHFLADGFSLDEQKNKLRLLLLSFGLPLVIAISFPHIFLSMLGISGGFGCATLLGVMPILMVWKAKLLPRSSKLFILLLAFVGFEMLIEIYNITTRL